MEWTSWSTIGEDDAHAGDAWRNKQPFSRLHWAWPDAMVCQSPDLWREKCIFFRNNSRDVIQTRKLNQTVPMVNLTDRFYSGGSQMLWKQVDLTDEYQFREARRLAIFQRSMAQVRLSRFITDSAPAGTSIMEDRMWKVGRCFGGIGFRGVCHLPWNSQENTKEVTWRLSFRVYRNGLVETIEK
jgi:hypothetical protein